MSFKPTWILSSAIAFFLFSICSNQASAQTIQLPSVGFFNVNTTVSVPDGGMTYLGGVSRSRSGSISRGVPGLSSIPGLNRGFRNQAIGKETSRSTAAAKVDLIIMSEYEAEVMAEANRRAALRTRTDPNGSEDAQRKADFISRNIGRKK